MHQDPSASHNSAGRPRDAAKIYKERHQRFTQEAKSIARSGGRIENFRGASFAALVVGAGYYFAKGSEIGGLVALVSAVVFAWLVQHHGKILEKEAEKRRYSIVNEHAHLRLSGKWHDLPRAGITFAPKDHPYAEDLDLFGLGSLYQRISVAHTRYGQSTLAEWISSPAKIEELRARQLAVVELSPQLEFRQKFEAEGMALVEKKRGNSIHITDGPNPHRLLAWVSTPAKIAGSYLVVGLSWLLPLATLSGIYAHAWLDLPPYYWIAPVVCGMILLSVTKGPTSDTFAAVSTTEGAFLRYGTLLETLEALKCETPWLRTRIEKLLTQGGVRPSHVMRKFRTLVSWYDLRHNGMAYPFINGIFLWDLHCTRALERWKQHAGTDLHRWFEVIGEIEAISSLASLNADDPAASIPELTLHSGETPASLVAKRLGHPLLPAHGRVSNDVDQVRPGEALLVTGSNMSGKSTFLRALGVNAVLAFAGGPVIAEKLSLPMCVLGTSIRVSDSLKSGVSHFLAEVQKLALVVKASGSGDVPVLFLLDEVLHGTNSRERQIGARWVLGELLKKNALGVITTHDMELCRLPPNLMDRVRKHHFRESVRDGKMTFDYTLREGPVTSGNALRLMQTVGLAVPLEPEEVPKPEEAN